MMQAKPSRRRMMTPRLPNDDERSRGMLRRMGINDWSDTITIAELTDEPAFSDDLDGLLDRIERTPAASTPDVILDLRTVSRLNSSNIAQMLRLRKMMLQAGKSLRVCSVNDDVRSILQTTQIEGLFTFNSDVATALASLQIDG